MLLLARHSPTEEGEADVRQEHLAICYRQVEGTIIKMQTVTQS